MKRDICLENCNLSRPKTPNNVLNALLCEMFVLCFNKTADKCEILLCYMY